MVDFACFLFGQCEGSVKELGVLANRPLANFKNVIEKLNEHFVSTSRKYHQAVVEQWHLLM